MTASEWKYSKYYTSYEKHEWLDKRECSYEAFYDQWVRFMPWNGSTLGSFNAGYVYYCTVGNKIHKRKNFREDMYKHYGDHFRLNRTSVWNAMMLEELDIPG